MMMIASSSVNAFAGAAPVLRVQRATVPLMQEAASTEAPVPPPPPPLISVMRVGDKTLAGDFGFDPMGLADSSEKLAWYREAEVKHARLAMLAAAGWPLAEKLNGPLSSALGTKSMLVDGKAPSILNGGLGGVNIVYWVAVLGLAVFAESKYLDAQLNTGKRSNDYLPGMLEFDPLGQDSEFFRLAEIMNGRVAMLAITGFALEEAITKTSVVANTPFLFQPPF